MARGILGGSFRLAPAVAGVLTAAALARGQDAGPVSSADEDAALDDVHNPQGLPGRENGPRSLAQTAEQEAEPASPEREWFGGRDWWTWDHATGDWGGWRTDLEAAGLTIGASYTYEWSSVLRGGVRRGASTRSLLDANLTLDLEPSLGIEGGSLHADYESTDDGHPGGSLDAGDFQGFSNIQTARNLDELAEAWYQQTLLDGRFRVKLGKIDAGTEFAFPIAGAEFLNSAAGLEPTAFPIPTFPDSAFGAVAFVYPTDRTYIGGGVFDGAAAADGVQTGARGPATLFSDDLSNDWFWIGEGGLSWDALGAERSGRAAAGLWYHTGEFPDSAGGTRDGADGGYAIVEQRFWSAEPDNAECTRGLSAFVQLGWADDRLSPAAGHYAAGLVLSGISAARPNDAAGVYVSTVDVANGENETVIEAVYRLQLTPFISVKPDLQYIVNPGGDPTLDNALVGMLRVEVDF